MFDFQRPSNLPLPRYSVSYFYHINQCPMFRDETLKTQSCTFVSESALESECLRYLFAYTKFRRNRVFGFGFQKKPFARSSRALRSSCPIGKLFACRDFGGQPRSSISIDFQSFLMDRRDFFRILAFRWRFSRNYCEQIGN